MFDKSGISGAQRSRIMQISGDPVSFRCFCNEIKIKLCCVLKLGLEIISVKYALHDSFHIYKPEYHQ